MFEGLPTRLQRMASAEDPCFEGPPTSVEYWRWVDSSAGAAR